MKFENSLAFAQSLDQQDTLAHFRSRFLIPQHNGQDAIYFTGNSLGLQPKTTGSFIQQELDTWAQLGVEGWFNGTNPWLHYHEALAQPLANIVGALPHEVVAMSQLTVNIHLLLATFYRPTKERFKIICEAKAFPSDQYALASQAQLYELNPEDTIIEVKPRDGEQTVTHEDIIATISAHGAQTAVVLLGGLNYYNGQVLNMMDITEAAHKAGAYCGFDLAHAAGNIELKLHDWQTDFACWCSYKYLNSGPGGISGIYIHEKHATNISLPRLAGWWGNDKSNRFEMTNSFKPYASAEGWQLSTAPILLLAAHKASLQIFEEAGMSNLVQKGRQLSSYAQFIIQQINELHTQPAIQVITPTAETERGCQVSMLMLRQGKEVFETLIDKGVTADWREPNVIRVAPVPLYNSFEDVWRFGEIMKKTLQ
jgi:kynureninase